MRISAKLGGGILGGICALGACDPAFRFAGSVKDESGHPVPRVQARVQCETIFASAETDSAGRFEYNAIGWCPSSCTVEVIVDGQSAWTRPVMHLCRRRPTHFRNACLEVVAEATLTGESYAPPIPHN